MSAESGAKHALLVDLKAKLGGSFAQSAAVTGIHSHFIKQDKGLGAVGTLIAITS